MSKPTPLQCRDTALAAIFLLLILWFFSKNINFVYAAGGFALYAMILPNSLSPLARLWFGLSHVLGTVMSKVILSLAFFLVLTPMGLLRKALGKDSLHVACWKKGTDSVFRVRDHTFTAADIEQPF